jgi:hypothetical protein
MRRPFQRKIGLLATKKTIANMAKDIAHFFCKSFGLKVMWLKVFLFG